MISFVNTFQHLLDLACPERRKNIHSETILNSNNKVKPTWTLVSNIIEEQKVAIFPVVDLVKTYESTIM